jgi:hypothetical protein
LYSPNLDDKGEERMDTRLLTTKLENENFEDDLKNFVVNILKYINFQFRLLEAEVKAQLKLMKIQKSI